MPRISKKINLQKRKNEAKERLLAYVKLSITERLEELNNRPGQSKRERAKLTRRIPKADRN